MNTLAMWLGYALMVVGGFYLLSEATLWMLDRAIKNTSVKKEFLIWVGEKYRKKRGARKPRGD